jgi:hypothetical protein
MDWILLLMMSSLNLINMLFINEAEANEFNIICYEGIRDRYSKVMFRIVRFKNFVSTFFIFIVLAVLVYFIGKAQTNLISTAFYFLNIMNIALIIKGDNRKGTNEKIYSLNNFIKLFAAVILLVDIAFIVFIGELEKPDMPNSLDQKLKRTVPLIYDNFDLIGFRVFEFQDKPLDEEKRREVLKIKFLSYIAYLMVAIYLSNLYREKAQDNLGEQEFGESDYKNIFEYKDEKDLKKRIEIDELVVVEREEERRG